MRSFSTCYPPLTTVRKRFLALFSTVAWINPLSSIRPRSRAEKPQRGARPRESRVEICSAAFRRRRNAGGEMYRPEGSNVPVRYTFDLSEHGLSEKEKGPALRRAPITTNDSQTIATLIRPPFPLPHLPGASFRVHVRRLRSRLTLLVAREPRLPRVRG
jgi:hypothetical protein